MIEIKASSLNRVTERSDPTYKPEAIMMEQRVKGVRKIKQEVG
jgi:hypothetical protein